METLSLNAFQAALGRCIGATFVGLVTCTETKMKKTGNPFFGKVRSIRRVNVQINYNYDDAVVRQLEKEINAERIENEEEPLTDEQLEAEVNERFRRGHSFYQAIVDDEGRLTPFAEGVTVNTKGIVYLRCRTLHKGETTYVATEDIEIGDVVYEAGSEIPFAALEIFFPKSKPYANQGTEDPIRATTFKLDSIRAANFNGKRFKVVPSERQDNVPEAASAYAYGLIDGLEDRAPKEAVTA